MVCGVGFAVDSNICACGVCDLTEINVSRAISWSYRRTVYKIAVRIPSNAAAYIGTGIVDTIYSSNATLCVNRAAAYGYFKIGNIFAAYTCTDVCADCGNSAAAYGYVRNGAV